MKKPNRLKKSSSALIKLVNFLLLLPTKLLKKIDRNFYIPIAIIIGSVIIAGAITMSFEKDLQTTRSPSQKTTSAQPLANPTTSPLAQPNFPPASNFEPVKPTDHLRGAKNAQIVLIEYSDLECPFCKQFHPTLKKILDSYNNQTAWVFRHFPLDSLHPRADKEAEAVECAFEQAGNVGFWKLVDKIYEVTPSNNGLEPSQLPALAEQVGLNGTALKLCIDSGNMAAKVEAQFQDGIKAGVNGTPGTIILNTKTGKSTLVSGAIPFETLKRAIDEFIKGS